MRLPGDDEYRNSGLSMKYMMLGVTLCLLLVLGVVVMTNKETPTKKAETQEKTVLALEHEESGQQSVADEADVQKETGKRTESAGDNTNGKDTTLAGEVNSEMDNTVASSVVPDSIAMDNNMAANSMAVDNRMASTMAEENPKRDSETSQQSSETMIMGFNGGKSLQDVERLYKEGKLVASDLDFWDMYPEQEAEVIRTSDTAGQKDKASKKADASEEEDKADSSKAENEKSSDRYSRFEEAAQKELESDPSRDGKHTLIKGADGSEEWVLINPYLEQNTYDFSKLSMKNKKMVYYEDGRQTSYVGVDLSKYNNEVDFQSLKAAGVDFVMLRLGSRGYGSGQIMLDERFVEYITKATEAGLQIGVYFYSQAITKDEAVEEANFVIQNLANYKITYPVAFDMEYVKNDSARIDALTREEKTTIAKTFLKTIKEAGYKPMIYGTKEWLIKEIDLTKLTEYDIWLSQQEEEPDYPYLFQMWQYSLTGSVSGVTGDVDLNISFVDYSEK